VGAPAEVGELSLIIDGDLGIRRDGMKNLELEWLSRFLKEIASLLAGEGTAHDRGSGGNNFPHFLFDLFEILRRKGTVKAEVVIEAFLCGGADAYLSGRKKAFHCLGKNMGGTVPKSYKVTMGADGLPLVRVQGILSCLVFRAR
jgi:hypothetical protein